MAYSQQQPQQDPARLATALADLVVIGGLKGFKHFDTCLRGREELILQVKTSASQKCLPFSNSVDIALSQRQASSRRVQKGNAMSVQSPSDQDLENDSQNISVLLAVYARYGRPYVWLRSKHGQRFRGTDHAQEDDSMPIQLDTTAQWFEKNLALHDIIEQVVSMSVQPPPANPFAVDIGSISNLPPEETIIRAGALISFLQKIYHRDPSYATEVLSDISTLQRIMFTDMHEFLK
ncbi:hypothetical protein SpCBS45565_g06683 [Spizellomyces sp. 'palustris']|nr:hypothetical protein SpCBS45565_g06683 [Spizellomyces sp. 'palustris']